MKKIKFNRLGFLKKIKKHFGKEVSEKFEQKTSEDSDRLSHLRVLNQLTRPPKELLKQVDQLANTKLGFVLGLDDFTYEDSLLEGL